MTKKILQWWCCILSGAYSAWWFEIFSNKFPLWPVLFARLKIYGGYDDILFNLILFYFWIFLLLLLRIRQMKRNVFLLFLICTRKKESTWSDVYAFAHQFDIIIFSVYKYIYIICLFLLFFSLFCSVDFHFYLLFRCLAFIFLWHTWGFSLKNPIGIVLSLQNLFLPVQMDFCNFIYSTCLRSVVVFFAIFFSVIFRAHFFHILSFDCLLTFHFYHARLFSIRLSNRSVHYTSVCINCMHWLLHICTVQCHFCVDFHFILWIKIAVLNLI